MDTWERQSGEGSKAFHNFEHYRDMPVGIRSIDAAYSEHRKLCTGQLPITRKAPRNWKKWSVDHRWVARVDESDADLSRRRRERRSVELDKAYDQAADLSKLALLKLAQRISDLEPEDVPASVLDRHLKTYSDVLFRALGHQDRFGLEHTGKDGGAISVDVSAIEAKIRAMGEISEPTSN